MPGSNHHPTVRELAVTAMVAAAVLLVASTVFYGPEIINGSRLFFTNDVTHSDFWHLNYPAKAFLKEELAQGRLPLWCPRMGTGFPLHAASEVGSLYLPHLILFSVLPLALALNWAVLLNVVLCGAFFAMYVRQLGASRSASVFGATAFALSGFFVVHLKHTAMAATAAWAPFLLLLLERHARSGSRRTLALTSLAVACMLLAGHVQVAYNGLLMAAFYGTWLLIAKWRSPTGGRNAALGLFARMVLASVLGVLMACPQILPTAELNSVGPRQTGLTMAEATVSELEWKHLYAMVQPHAFGNPAKLKSVPLVDEQTGQQRRDPMTGAPMESFELQQTSVIFWEIIGYIGIFALVLAACGIGLGRRRSHALKLAVFALLALLLALGSNGGVFYLLYHALPGFDSFRLHSRFLLFVSMWLAALASLGLTFVVQRTTRTELAGALAGCAAVAIAFVDLFVVFGDHNSTVRAEKWLTAPEGARLILARHQKNEPPPRIFNTESSALVFRNAFFRAGGWDGNQPAYDAAWRIMDPNVASLYGVAHIGIFFPLYPTWSNALYFLCYPPPRSDVEAPTGVNGRLLSAFNVPYVLDTVGAMPRGAPLLGEFPGDILVRGNNRNQRRPYTIRLHHNDRALPRAFLVPEARVIGVDVESQVGAAYATDFDPRRMVYIARSADSQGLPSDQPGGPIPAPVLITNYTPQSITMSTTAPSDCWLFLGDTHYPGWVARVDGVETTIHRANIAGRAVRVPAGPHRIEFEYSPASFRNGVYLAVTGVLLLALTLLLQTVRSKGLRAATA